MNSRYIGPLNYSINSYKTNICLHLNNQTKELCKTLYRNGLISSYSISKKKRLINVFFLYTYNNLLILSTNKGYLTNEEALRYKVGGEVLCLLK